MSNYKTVFFTLGILQIILGIFMFIPIITQFFYQEIDSSFFGASIVTIIFGVLFFLSNLDHENKLNLQQAFLLTALSWLSVAIFGSLPFFLSPTALQRLFHHTGEMGVGEAAENFDTFFGISSLSTVSAEEISKLKGPKIFQLYYHIIDSL